MKIVGMMPCRNEDWVIGLSARAAMMWLDELVILDHASTDKTPDILMDLAEEYPDRITVLSESNPVWEEMAHRQRMLTEARKRGGTHMAIVDADEVLTGNLLLDIRRMICTTPRHCILQIPWLCLRGAISRVHTSGPWADGQNVSMAFLGVEQLHWSSDGRQGYDFHHRQPMGSMMAPLMPLGAHRNRTAGLMHLQFVSDRRLRAKQALYKITELLRWPGREPIRAVDERYNLAVYGSYHQHASLGPDESLATVPAEWWEPYLHLFRHLNPNAEPWQEREVKRLYAEHGAAKFAGLDLFGVTES